MKEPPPGALRAPTWLPRLTRLRGRKSLAFFRKIVRYTIELRVARLNRDPDGVPQDFLTLLLRAEGPDGLSRAEIEDNLITFIGAGHETTARALGWTLYCLSNAAWERLGDAGRKQHMETDREIVEALGAAARIRLDPDSDEVQEVVAKHFEWLTAIWTPNAEAYITLTQMYVDDERFRGHYDEITPGAAALLRDAAAIYAERHLT